MLHGSATLHASLCRATHASCAFIRHELHLRLVERHVTQSDARRFVARALSMFTTQASASVTKTALAKSPRVSCLLQTRWLRRQAPSFCASSQTVQTTHVLLVTSVGSEHVLVIHDEDLPQNVNQPCGSFTCTANHEVVTVMEDENTMHFIVELALPEQNLPPSPRV